MAIRDGFIAELRHEGGNTRKMLERLPADQFNWRPDPRSTTSFQLAHHIANLQVFVRLIIQEDGFDFSQRMEKPVEMKTTQELVSFFDHRLEESLQVLSDVPDERMMQKWEFRKGGEVLFQLPRVVALRNIVLNHIVHHRGQLSVYLRLLDIPVPGMYGPSADE